MEDNTKDLILECLNNDSPLIFFVGQNYINNDAVLESLQKRIKKEGISWSRLHLLELTKEDQNFLRDKFSTLRLPESIQTAFQLNWSAIFTSSIDPRIRSALSTRNREPEIIIKGQDYRPKNIRSIVKTPIFYLFSNIEAIHTNETPPFNPTQYGMRKRTDASNMLHYINDSATGGILVVEGLSENDWLEIADLLYTTTVQIIWCNIKDKPINSEVYQHFLNEGRIYEEEGSVSELVSILYAENKINFSDLQETDQIITLEHNNYLELEPQHKIQIESSAYIIYDSWLKKIEDLENKESIELFQKFHRGTLSLRNNFLSILSGYSIEREFEKNLLPNVLKNEITLLKGEPATGKSIALVALAIKLKKIHQLPILYANMVIPNVYDVDMFCQKAEEAGASKSIIICDLNSDENKYFDLLKNLKSKGRRVSIVGTTYDSSIKNNGNGLLIESSPCISEEEFKQLEDLLKKYYPRIANSKIKQTYNRINPQYFLPFLYRRLLDAQPRLDIALIRHAQMVKDIIANKIWSIERKLDQTVFQELFKEADISVSKDNPIEEEIDPKFQDIAYKLLDYVMVFGKNRESIPIHLLIKALNDDQVLREKQIDIYAKYSKELYYLMNELNYFIVTHNEDLSFIKIKARSYIEAETYCKVQNISTENEINIICNIIKSINNQSYDEKIEKNYILDLINSLEEKNLSIEIYEQIAEAMDYIRVHKGYEDDFSIALRESSILRKIVNTSDFNNNHLEPKKRFEILEKAREMIQNSLERLNQSNNAHRIALGNLKTELASIYGYLAIGETKADNQDNSNVEKNYITAKKLIDSSFNDVNYYPVDTQLWIIKDLLQRSGNSDFHNRIKVDFYALIDQVNQDIFSPKDKIRFLQRKELISRRLGDDKMNENAIKKLISLSPDRGHYIKARNMCDAIFENMSNAKSYDEETLDSVKEAYNHLRENISQLGEYSSKLIFELFWIINIKEKYSNTKKQPLHDNEKFLSEGLEYIEKLSSTSNITNSNKFMFLKAVFSWMTGSSEEAERLWKELETLSDYNDPRRTKLQLYIADENNRPKKYNITVNRRIDHKRWEGTLLNQDHTRKVIINEKNFNSDQLQNGQIIENVVIAFNYIGALALRNWK